MKILKKRIRISSYADQSDARKWLWQYVDQVGLNGFSLKQAADYICERTGHRPALNTVSAYMRDRYTYREGGWIKK